VHVSRATAADCFEPRSVAQEPVEINQSAASKCIGKTLLVVPCIMNQKFPCVDSCFGILEDPCQARRRLKLSVVSESRRTRIHGFDIQASPRRERRVDAMESFTDKRQSGER
jgi:hypothetical protein